MKILRFAPLKTMDDSRNLQSHKDSTCPWDWAWNVAELVFMETQEEKRRRDWNERIIIMEMAGRYTQQTAGQPTHSQGRPYQISNTIHGPSIAKSRQQTLIHILLQKKVSKSEMEGMKDFSAQSSAISCSHPTSVASAIKD
jgi:hypothetical protein